MGTRLEILLYDFSSGNIFNSVSKGRYCVIISARKSMENKPIILNVQGALKV